MVRTERPGPRILALDPSARGFGWVVMEGPASLVDWGLADARGDQDRNLRCLDRLDSLVKRYRPTVLVFEDPEDPRSRRHPRVQRLLTQMTKLADRWGVRAVPLRKRAVLRAFAASRARTKYHRAVILCARHPELRRHLPPKRRLWMSQDPRMAIFEAAALAAAFFRDHRCKIRRRKARAA